MWLQTKAWIIENANWVGFAAMSFIGSVVGHIKAYEASAVEWPIKKHFWDLFKRCSYAVFIALIIYLGYDYFKIAQPIAFILTGIFSVFGSETIDFFYERAKVWFVKSAENKV